MSVVSFGSPEDYYREVQRRAAEHQLAVNKMAQTVKRAPIVPQPPWHPNAFPHDPRLWEGWTLDDGNFPRGSVPR
jgi:hypothetical protein